MGISQDIQEFHEPVVASCDVDRVRTEWEKASGVKGTLSRRLNGGNFKGHDGIRFCRHVREGVLRRSSASDVGCHVKELRITWFHYDKLPAVRGSGSSVDSPPKEVGKWDTVFGGGGCLFVDF